MQATIYSKTNCPYCVKAKMLLNQKNIPYQEYVIGVDSNSVLQENQHVTTREKLLELAPNAKTVPQIWLDQTHIGGYDQLVVWFQNQ